MAWLYIINKHCNQQAFTILQLKLQYQKQLNILNSRWQGVFNEKKKAISTK